MLKAIIYEITQGMRKQLHPGKQNEKNLRNRGYKSLLGITWISQASASMLKNQAKDASGN